MRTISSSAYAEPRRSAASSGASPSNTISSSWPSRAAQRRERATSSSRLRFGQSDRRTFSASTTTSTRLYTVLASAQRGQSGRAEDHPRRKAEAVGAARDAQAVACEGAADVREGPRRRGRAVRRGRARAPNGVRGAEALVREGRRPLGAEGREGAERPARDEVDRAEAPRRRRDVRRRRLLRPHEAGALRAREGSGRRGPVEHDQTGARARDRAQAVTLRTAEGLPVAAVIVLVERAEVA